MDTKANYTLVGAAIVLATAALVGFIVWLAGRGVKNETARYTIYFKETSLYGLQRNSDVTMRGIKVGSVADFKISPNNIELVRVTIEVDEATPVKTDTKAVINRNLLTGFASIDLTGSSRQSPLLLDTPPGEPLPVIPEGKSELDAIASSLPGLMQEVGQITSRANSFFSEENKRALDRTLESTARFSEFLASAGPDLLKSTNIVLSDVSTLSRSLERLSGASEQEIKGGGAQFEQSMKQLQSTAASLQKELSELSAAMQRATNVFVVESTAVARDVSQAAQSFSSTMEKFEDPQSIILGPNVKALGPGEEPKKR